MPQLSCYAPFGAITISEDANALVSLDWGWGRDQQETPLLARAREMLEHYFDGRHVSFDLPLRPYGTPYQLKVWASLRCISYGMTRTYSDLAANVGGSPRTVGRAVGANPLPIIIPCHRVVGRNDLGGYSAGNGVDDKKFLLSLEGAQRDHHGRSL